MAVAALPMGAAMSQASPTPTRMVTMGVTSMSILVSLDTALPNSAAMTATKYTDSGPPAPPSALVAKPTGIRENSTMRVVVPSDAESTRALTVWAAGTAGPVYLRLSRDVYPDLYPAGTKFEAGRGAVVRGGTDVTVIACGLMVHKALEAAEALAARGVSVRVVDMYSIKPIDRELILKCAGETGAIVTAEEHSIIGGLGSAVSEVLAWAGAGVPTEFVGVRDTFTESGKYAELLREFGVDAKGVEDGIGRALARK